MYERINDMSFSEYKWMAKQEAEDRIGNFNTVLHVILCIIYVLFKVSTYAFIKKKIFKREKFLKFCPIPFYLKKSQIFF